LKKWNKREKEIMKLLGLKPQPASGSGWLLKEDGESSKLMAQLKSTEQKAIRIDRQVIKDLVYHARLSHKVPILVLDYVDDFLLVCARKDDLGKVVKALEGVENDEDSV
jgi:hypothetical protein